uniref:PINc domain-containing protein n=1 Tax=Onchocerca volvulus TaxID=6282 RepID=A0A2K6W0U5_ONCVO
MSSNSIIPSTGNSVSSMIDWKVNNAVISLKPSCMCESQNMLPAKEMSEMEINDHGTKQSISENDSVETDLIIGKVRSFRHQNFWRPNLQFKNFALSANAGNYMESNGTKKNAGAAMVVFDTSVLLRDATLLPFCIEKLCHVLIPYTVLKELDGLKKTEHEKLRMKVIKTYGYLHEYAKRGCYYLHIENMFEASFGAREFGCQNNDDIILKCVLITTKRYRNAGVSVMFVTTDKSLAVKAMAHNIFTVDGNELFHLLITNSSRANKPRSAGSSMQSLYEFAHTVPVKHFYPKIRNDSQVLPKMFVRCSSPTFSPATFMYPPKGQFLVQNNGFSIQNGFCMPLWNEVSIEGPQILSPYAVQMIDETTCFSENGKNNTMLE